MPIGLRSAQRWLVVLLCPTQAQQDSDAGAAALRIFEAPSKPRLADLQPLGSRSA